MRSETVKEKLKDKDQKLKNELFPEKEMKTRLLTIKWWNDKRITIITSDFAEVNVSNFRFDFLKTRIVKENRFYVTRFRNKFQLGVSKSKEKNKSRNLLYVDNANARVSVDANSKTMI